MSKEQFIFGDLVLLIAGDFEGTAGIVSKPYTEEKGGHVLIHKDGNVLGIACTIDEVKLADEKSSGFAQLAYSLIKLGSHVIDKKLIGS